MFNRIEGAFTGLVNCGPVVTPHAILQSGPELGVADYGPKDHEALRTAAEFVSQYLASPHSDLGRKGPVCPYIRESIERSCLWITSSNSPFIDIEAVVATLRQSRILVREIGADLPPPIRILVAVFIIFPNLPLREACEMIEHVQGTLKSEFVSEGLMIGQFYPDCTAPGLHNAAFRPFDSPIPSIAIRHMTIHDAPFLTARDEHVDSFRRVFGGLAEKRLHRLLPNGKQP